MSQMKLPIKRQLQSYLTQTKKELETISIAELLQNRQHVQTPYLDQIWHATVGQWSMLTGLISSVSLMRENCQNSAILANFFLQFWELLGPSSLLIQAKFGTGSKPIFYIYTPNFTWIRLLCHLPGSKTAILAKFWHLGAPVPSPFTDKGQIWYARVDPLSTLLDRFIPSYSCGQNRQILSFFGLRWFVVLPIVGIKRKLNVSAQLQTFLYPTVSKSFLCSNDFMAKSYAQSLSLKSVINK